MRSASGRLSRIADGALSPELAPRRDVSGRPVERSLLNRLDGHDSDDRECFAGGYVRATASGTVEAETTVRR